mgnify:CR=1 FL=1|jgi:hypothetical protein
MKLFKTILLLIIVSINFSALKAQDQRSFKIQKATSINVSELGPSFHAEVYNLEAPYPGSDSYRNYIHQLKDLRFTNFAPTIGEKKSIKATNSDVPNYDAGFEGNLFGGIPNDNDVAISNDGKVVSVSNSDVYIYEEDGSFLLKRQLEDFSDSLGLVANSYDPKIIYDPSMDRFVLFFLNGNDQAATAIVVCFSQSNDPTQGWNIYSLPGNPYSDGAWSDFPMVAMTAQDVFVTVNHIHSDSASWQTGFMQSVIWQVQKEEAYNGAALMTVLHSNIKFNNKPIRNLMPVEGGVNLKDNEMYFISNRNFDFQNDTFFVVKIPQSIAENSNVSTSVQFALANQDYGLPPDAKQTTTTFLQTNDARPLGGFIENGIIQFVGNTVNLSTGLAAIYHGKLNALATLYTVDLEVLSDPLLEYGYPNISFSGQTSFDEQAIISFNHTSIDSFPGMSAIFYSANDGYSERLHLITGTSNVNLIAGNFERWGDYSGSQRRFNLAGEVWVSGFIGFRNNLALSKDQHRTYIAKLSSKDNLNVAIKGEFSAAAKIYPNPVEERMYVQFDLPTSMNLDFVLIDILGKQISLIENRKVNAGRNELIFMTTKLAKGTYFLKISNASNQLFYSEQFLKN